MTKAIYEYDVIVGDKEQAVYTHATRDSARAELREAKADGFDGKIIQKKYVLESVKVVR